ncbi:serine hydrolase domain-containing protein [Radicibacter daui]|uniref:serine hydrolase domain-containing protein n=1 Tax=Radicibacter daui TaxID=3064829 RepID=UPI004046C402
MTPSSATALAKRLDGIVHAAIDARKIVGAVLVAFRRGQPCYQGSRGLADREASRPMAIDTIFRLSSLTKPIVAAAFLAMVDKGLMRPEDDIRNYLPEFHPALADGSRPVIRLVHLLAHTAGIGDVLPGDPEPDALPVKPEMNAGALVTALSAVPLLFPPGTRWRYSRALEVLAAAMCRVNGSDLAGVIERYVAGPLGLRDTAFGVTEPARLAAAYADGPQGGERMTPRHRIGNPWGGITEYFPQAILAPCVFQSASGGMAGTGGDFVVLLEALRTGQLFERPDTRALALSNLTPQLPFAVSPGWQFGTLGAWLASPAEAASPCGPGTVRWGGIYGHSWFIDPEAELTVVAMTNTGLEGSDGTYPLAIRDAFYPGAGVS